MDVSWLFRQMVEAGVTIGGSEILRKAVSKFFEKTAETAAPKFEKWASLQFGIPSQDERMFNEASKKMKHNWHSRLMARLRKLTREQSDYYRIYVAHDDVDEYAARLLYDAEMDDPTWDDYIDFMLEDFNKTKAQFERFQKFAGTTMESLGNFVKNQSTALDELIDDSKIIELNEKLKTKQVTTIKKLWKDLMEG